ncbi:DnaA N-terminal domain-containing protein [Oceanobacillus sp. CFH 90083]|uniref:DnaA N-terminal domain-containing protein n=1 Tax=Oceanobacillus sp. CFH 90083 TaxID=2592336 RepID=UPI00128D7D98|nr:DnaA N-terminal domain-containing protein [Oceanobacillus sp. CFH 90083]
MDIWKKVLEKISVQISKPSFDTWFKKTSMELEEGVLTVYAPNEFTIDWLEDQYGILIANTVKEVTGEDYDIQFAETDTNAESIFQNTRLEPVSIQYDTDSISRLERKIDRLEQKVQQLIDIKRLDERAEQLEERIRKLEQNEK